MTRVKPRRRVVASDGQTRDTRSSVSSFVITCDDTLKRAPYFSSPRALPPARRLAASRDPRPRDTPLPFHPHFPLGQPCRFPRTLSATQLRAPCSAHLLLCYLHGVSPCACTPLHPLPVGAPWRASALAVSITNRLMLTASGSTDGVVSMALLLSSTTTGCACFFLPTTPLVTAKLIRLPVLEVLQVADAEMGTEKYLEDILRRKN